MHRLPTWAVLSIIPAAAMLGPVVAFLTAVAIALFLGTLRDSGVLTLVALAEAGVIGRLLFRKLPAQPALSVRAKTSARVVKLHRSGVSPAGSP
jgi:hypothetical protein